MGTLGVDVAIPRRHVGRSFSILPVDVVRRMSNGSGGPAGRWELGVCAFPVVINNQPTTQTGPAHTT